MTTRIILMLAIVIACLAGGCDKKDSPKSIAELRKELDELQQQINQIKKDRNARIQTPAPITSEPVAPAAEEISGYPNNRVAANATSTVTINIDEPQTTEKVIFTPAKSPMHYSRNNENSRNNGNNSDAFNNTNDNYYSNSGNSNSNSDDYGDWYYRNYGNGYYCGGNYQYPLYCSGCYQYPWYRSFTTINSYRLHHRPKPCHGGHPTTHHPTHQTHYPAPTHHPAPTHPIRRK